MSDSARRVACPSCGTEVIWNESSKWRPFCSERCRLIDLGKWFEEEHKISTSIDALEDPHNPSKPQ